MCPFRAGSTRGTHPRRHPPIARKSLRPVDESDPSSERFSRSSIETVRYGLAERMAKLIDRLLRHCDIGLRVGGLGRCLSLAHYVRGSPATQEARHVLVLPTLAVAIRSSVTLSVARQEEGQGCAMRPGRCGSNSCSRS